MLFTNLNSHRYVEEQQGEMLDNIEVHVARSAEYTQAGARALVKWGEDFCLFFF